MSIIKVRCLPLVGSAKDGAKKSLAVAHRVDIPVTLHGEYGDCHFQVRFDSAADISLFPLSALRKAGVNKSVGTIHMSTLVREYIASVYEVEFTVCSKTVSTRVAALPPELLGKYLRRQWKLCLRRFGFPTEEHLEHQFGLLSLSDVLRHFNISIEQSKKSRMFDLVLSER